MNAKINRCIQSRRVFDPRAPQAKIALESETPNNSANISPGILVSTATARLAAKSNISFKAGVN